MPLTFSQYSSITTITFVFLILTITFAYFIVFFSNPVFAVLALIFVFLLSACILILFGAEFLAFIYVIVYLGAVLILFLWVVMTMPIKKNIFLHYRLMVFLLITFNVVLLYSIASLKGTVIPLFKIPPSSILFTDFVNFVFSRYMFAFYAETPEHPVLFQILQKTFPGIYFEFNNGIFEVLILPRGILYPMHVIAKCADIYTTGPIGRDHNYPLVLHLYYSFLYRHRVRFSGGLRGAGFSWAYHKFLSAVFLAELDSINYTPCYSFSLHNISRDEDAEILLLLSSDEIPIDFRKFYVARWLGVLPRALAKTFGLAYPTLILPHDITISVVPAIGDIWDFNIFNNFTNEVTWSLLLNNMSSVSTPRLGIFLYSKFSILTIFTVFLLLIVLVGTVALLKNKK